MQHTKHYSSKQLGTTSLGGTRAIAVLCLAVLVARITMAHESRPNNQQANIDGSSEQLQMPEYPHQNQQQVDQSASAGKITTQGEFFVPNSRPTRHIHNEPKKIIDLSYKLNSQTLHWPANSGFNYSVQNNGSFNNSRGESYHLKSDSFCTAIHTGTHLDAPVHFSALGWTVDRIPLDRLIDVPLTVIDVSAKVKLSRNYSFTKDDFVDNKTNKSLVKAGSVVLVYTGISNFYNQGEKAYFGTDSKMMSEMSIPGFGLEAANFLVEQKVYGVGLDAPSADSSQRHGTNNLFDPQAHVAFNTNNIYILENINGNLSQLIGSESARLTAAPLTVESGSGSPVRLVAIMGHDECNCYATNSAQTGANQLNLIVLISLLVCIIALML